jgi:tripartite-type tricarboxylate transporter receptor subunit TctC
MSAKCTLSAIAKGSIVMNLPRRRLLHLLSGAAVSLVSARFAAAENYPTRPVRILVGFAAGGATDIIARLVGQSLSERLGNQFVVENRPGASTNLATEVVVRAPADGHTLLLIGPPAAINVTLYDNLKFNFIRDIVPVAAIVRAPFAVVVDPSFPAKTMAEFIAYAKANPGKLSMATPGSGTGPEMAGELFKLMTGIDMLTVRYRGDAPALTDLMGGQVQVYFAAMPPAIELIKAGKLRPLAVTTAARAAAVPDIPALGELLPGFEASWLSGIGAPKDTPPEIVAKLNRAINEGLADPQIKERLARLGGVPLPMTPDEYKKLLADEIDKWGQVIHAAKIRPE